MKLRRRGLALLGALVMAGSITIVSVGTALASDLGNMVFFRGGFTRTQDDRGGQVFTDTFGLGSEFPPAGPDGSFANRKEGWYVGAGLELLLSKNLWGMMPKTWAVGEVGIEYRNFGIKDVNRVVPTAVLTTTTGAPATGLCAGTVAPATCARSLDQLSKVRLTAFSVDIGPKIKFFEGGMMGLPIRPWILPAALAVHVISPPSNAATVLDVGYQVGGGVDFEVIHGIVVGVDARYNITAGHAFSGETLPDGSRRSNNYLTAGGYLGINF